MGFFRIDCLLIIIHQYCLRLISLKRGHQAYAVFKCVTQRCFSAKEGKHEEAERGRTNERSMVSWYLVSSLLSTTPSCPPSALTKSMCVNVGGGGLLCTEGSEAFTPYWMVIVSDRYDGCCPYLALCLHCLPFFYEKVSPRLWDQRQKDEKTQDGNLEVGRVD